MANKLLTAKEFREGVRGSFIEHFKGRGLKPKRGGEVYNFASIWR